ncbi:CAP domain-containing protein [Flavobacterium crassostreae]|uniref:SCP domain-containing protein n=1 Tax=Flavobacterium crassostreae TaxID=1763534 RepID=A0A1B9DKK4_9FLAO|nr:CAP domain-containing protein [Flavobacterium crassostreae]OCB70228.1 hypothetical protein LPBF_12360 [Flavobacterium crassostreae]
MKTKLYSALVFCVLLLTTTSCSSDGSDAAPVPELPATSENIENYTYKDNETETLKLINEYRVDKGLSSLQVSNYISLKCSQHNQYMIANKKLSHDNFESRSADITKTLNAISVGENLAFNYTTPQAALTGWVNSPPHLEILVGNYSHFGIAISVDSSTGKNYYTTIFAKL